MVVMIGGKIMIEANTNNSVARKHRGMKILIIGIIVLIVAAAAVMVHSVLKDRNMPEASSDADVVSVGAMTVDSSSEYAKNLYGYKVDDTVDSAAVAKLLEAMNLADITGEYSVKITTDNDTDVMALTVATAVDAKDKETFDKNVALCAQQIFALVPNLDKIEWTYSVISSENVEETATLSMDTVGAADGLEHEMSYYSGSAKKFKKLLEEQAEGGSAL
jgi:flagellar basal body-associated protein FliL